jgi:hypothetical protein
MKRGLLVLLLVGGCVSATEPTPLPPCARIPIYGAHGKLIAYTYRIDYIGKVPLCAIPH